MFLQEVDMIRCVSPPLLGLTPDCRRFKATTDQNLFLTVKLLSALSLFKAITAMLPASSESPDNISTAEKRHSGIQLAGISLSSLCICNHDDVSVS